MRMLKMIVPVIFLVVAAGCSSHSDKPAEIDMTAAANRAEADIANYAVMTNAARPSATSTLSDRPEAVRPSRHNGAGRDVTNR